MIQDTIPQSSGDSPMLLRQGAFPFAEEAPAETKTDTQVALDPKKKFIESQIRTKVDEVVKKNTPKKDAGQGSFVFKPGAKDSALYSIPVSDSQAFHFKDIQIRRAERKELITSREQVTNRRFYGEHLLLPKHGVSQSINSDYSVWGFMVLFSMVSSFAWIRAFYSRTIRQIFQAIVSMSASNQLVRDENLLLQRASVFLTILFNLVAAFFLYQISVIFEWNSDYIGSGFGRFLIFALIVSFVYTFKFIIIKATGYVFLTDKPLSGYIFNIFLINNAIGMALLPLVIAIRFLPPYYSRLAVFIALGLVFVGFLYRIIRGLLIGLGYSEFSKFYLLLYLCALEIVPMLILAKVFMA